MYSVPDFKPASCSMSGSNYCFLTCIQVSQEAGQVVWYSHLFKNFPQFVVVHTVKGFSVVNEAEVDVFMEFSMQEYWSGLPFPSPGDFPDSGFEPRSPTLQADSLLSEPPGKT